MLSKLIKHEFRATARYMWVIYLAMVVLSIGGGISMNNLQYEASSFVETLLVLLLIGWVLALMAGGIMTVAMVVHRFYKNLLTDEGYLTFTLPVSVHQLILSKLIVGLVWSIATAILMILCCVLALVSAQELRVAWTEVMPMLRDLLAGGDKGSLVMFALEYALLIPLGCACAYLQLYSAMAFGYSFSSHKFLWSVIAFFVLQFASQLISGLISTAGGIYAYVFMDRSIGISQQVHLMLLSWLGMTAVGCVVYYVITYLCLKKRLNLS